MNAPAAVRATYSEKPCYVCNIVKPLADFHKHKLMKDGHAGICKECHRERCRAYHRSTPAVQEYDRKRAKLPHRKAHIAKNTLRWRRENPEKSRAEASVSYALKKGTLVRKAACENCGDDSSRLHAHHADYSKRLDVKWLCAKCHHRMHAEQRRAS